MQLRAINHINIATQNLPETRDFFVTVLGLTEGFRPTSISPATGSMRAIRPSCIWWEPLSR